MRLLLTLTAALESATGIALLIVPARVVALLLGTELDAPGSLAIVRVAGSALIALGLACWLARREISSPAARGVVAAMLLYNIAVAVVLVCSRLDAGLGGPALWPAVILHVLFAAWCVRSLRT